MARESQERYLVLFGLIFQLFLRAESTVTIQDIPRDNSSPVQLQIMNDYVVVDNGIAKITFSNPGGMVTGINYNGIENILEPHNPESNRGYWDLVWSKPEAPGDNIDHLLGTKLRVILQNEDQVELSFTKTWVPTMNGTKLPPNDTHVPLNIDKRYIVLRGVPGFYSYATFEHLQGMHDMVLYQGRIVFKLQNEMFHYMAVSDDRQRYMPTAEDREKGRPLAYPEAVQLTDKPAGNTQTEVDDKYQYSTDDKDNTVHGWICSNPGTGFWVITPSREFRVAGPLKQDLTSHVGPVSLSMFFSTHYAGKSLGLVFQDGEPWKKVFGPVFIYLNSGSGNPRTLWEDAKKQMSLETSRWPYDFPRSDDYLSANKRGTVSGRLIVRDRYARNVISSAKFANVGLAAPGEAGSWQTEVKGYQFWTEADAQGQFLIKNVIPGTYNLYAWVVPYIGDYKLESIVTITPGKVTTLGNIEYVPPRNGPTLWEIGIPDRTAAEYYVPEPVPSLANYLYMKNKAQNFRQYGLWDRYTDMYPSNDLVFDVGANNYHKDWFFAHVNRRLGNNIYAPTTWKILFNLRQVDRIGNYTLQVALASATGAELQVRINDEGAKDPHFTTGLIGYDNAIARHGIHGLYRLCTINLSGSLFKVGKNILFLTQPRGGSPFSGFMYDYIRLEQPPLSK